MRTRRQGRDFGQDLSNMIAEDSNHPKKRSQALQREHQESSFL